jgi:ribonuclease HI
MAAKKYYAIAVGQKPGVYDNWAEAQAQVKGYPAARFKGFPSRKEAEAWLLEPIYAPAAPKAPKKSHAESLDISAKAGEVTIYTDGGSINNPGPGGYGIVMIHDGEEKELSGGFSLTTNNRMELMGAIVALKGLAVRDKPITLYSDSSYVVNGISKGWAKGWRKRGWLKSDKTPAVNPDLWAELLDLVQGLRITFCWVKGHAGNRHNERCDTLAVAAARKMGLPVDQGYAGRE